MGEVYRARDTRLGRDVAIKILPQIFTADPDRLARFEREARVLASLNHPNVAAMPDGKSLVYMQGFSSNQDFWLLDLATNTTRQLTRLTDQGAMRTFDVTPDGKQIVFDRLRENSDVVLIDLPASTSQTPQ